jgi:hypothetical protein
MKAMKPLKPTMLYRVAAGLLLLFTAAHTNGLLQSNAPGPRTEAVWQYMKHVHFHLMGADCTYAEFYIGFGLLVSAYLLFSAFFAWYLGDVARKNPLSIQTLGWAFFAVNVANLILSWKYFFAAPGIVAALICACVGLATWQIQQAAQA